MTYWVEYEYSYTFPNGEMDIIIEGGRFHCRKKDIKKAVEERVKEDLECERYSDLKICIYDAYPTTDCEV